jgi:hypothetical protein
MKAHKSKVAAAALVAALAVGVWAVGPRASHAAQGSAGDQLEAMLKQLDLTYKKVSPTTFKLVIEVQNEAVIIFLEASKLSWKDRKGGDLELAVITSKIMGPIPKEFNPPSAMLLKVAEINDKLAFGSVSMSKNKEGEWFVLRNLSFLLRGADTDVLFEYLRQAVIARDLRKQLQGFVEESK